MTGPPGSLRRAVLALLPLVVLACTRGAGVEHAGPPPGTGEPEEAAPPDAAVVVADAALPVDAAPPPPRPRARELPLEEGRSVYYALPAGPGPFRLVAHLHGICFPNAYSAGKWLGAATAVGALVAPTGNARCGDGPNGPPSWEAPTWEGLVAAMDADLERAIAKVDARERGALRRPGAILTGWSRGAFAAPAIARAHPGRWPYLVLVEANAPLSAASLRKSGVRAVALVAGEQGTELAGEQKTVAALADAGFPARLFVMHHTAHLYSDDIEDVMTRAFAFVLAGETDAGP
ncbi:MAG: hypothetical protein JWP97_2304 [Labilithrix sp.]|nr:hypothetical protein [Labilithrix sp.]